MTALDRAIEKTNIFIANHEDCPFGIKDVKFYAGLNVTVKHSNELMEFIKRHGLKVKSIDEEVEMVI